MMRYYTKRIKRILVWGISLVTLYASTFNSAAYSGLFYVLRDNFSLGAVLEQSEPIVEEMERDPIWTANMTACESSGDQSVINPEDLDGTASYGLWQFKPDTFRGFVRKYDLWDHEAWDEADWQNNLMSGHHQSIVIDHMLRDPDLGWKTWRYSLFPDCIHRHGMPTVWIYSRS